MATEPGVTSQLTLQFRDAPGLAAALRRHPGQAGLGALCIQVVKHYELGDLVQVTVELPEERLSVQGAVSWRRPGYIGVRLQPQSAEENRSFARLKTLVGSAAHGSPPGPPVEHPTKPFSE